MPRILIVTGEASGDLHGANLAQALRHLAPDVEILGIGGSKMKAAGVNMIRGIERHDVVGLIGLAQLRAVLRTYMFLGRYLRRTTLDAVVFIDYPGFNLRMARVAAKAGHCVIYYIAPQIWAWHPGRINLIARVVRRMIVILPFEEELYREAGVACSFVGHPLLDVVAPTYDRAELRKRFEVDASGPVVGLLPGSREGEVRALLPVMLEAAARLRQGRPDVQFVVAQAASVADALIEGPVTASGVNVRIARDQSSEVMAASDVLLVASGTATLQAAVIGTPMVITYKAPWLSYWIGRCVVRVKWLGLVNIVAGRSIVPELIQQEATSQRLVEEADRLLSDHDLYHRMCADLRSVRASLGESGASRRAAEVVLAECRR